MLEHLRYFQAVARCGSLSDFLPQWMTAFLESNPPSLPSAGPDDLALSA